MILPETLQATHFKPFIGEFFRVSIDQHVTTLELTALETYAQSHNSEREAFNLLFRGLPGVRLRQQVYQVEHEVLGKMDIFIVQHGDSPKGSEFGAVFN